MFPYLKMEFYKKPFIGEQTISGIDLALHNMFVGEINESLNEGYINICENDSVETVEKLFHQKFGLPVQVFRKQKKIWVAAIKTEKLTLSQENEKGEESCIYYLHAQQGSVPETVAKKKKLVTTGSER